MIKLLVPCVLIVGLVAASPAASDASGSESAFKQGLAQGGFDVREGAQRRIDAAYFVDNHIIDSAAGNNAGQAYKALQVPSLPKAHLDRTERTSGVFRLRSDEAVVYLGPTPPAADYFSFTPFLFERRKGSVVAKGDWMFAALGNPLNNMGIKSAGPTPFDSQTMIVFAADRGVYNRVRAQAIAAGYPESMINLYPLPSALLNMGVGPLADSLLVLVRTANVHDAEANKAFLTDDHYATVLRVTPRDPVPEDLLPTVPMAQRQWRSERELYPRLERSLDRLGEAILARTGHVSAKSVQSKRWWPESRKVLKATKGSAMYHEFVAGEAADTPYRRSTQNGKPVTFTLGDKDQIVVYGVNHAATGLATYSNFSVYGSEVLNPCGSGQYPTRFGCGNPVWSGVAGMASNGFAGTARRYLPNDPMAKYLYAVTVSRKALAKGKDTVVVPVPKQDKPAVGIPKRQPLFIGYRAYLNPNTGRGPAYGDVIPDRAIWMQVKP